MEISKTDLQKVVTYLNDACKLYEALPMQAMKCRAHMIRQLTAKLKTKLNGDGKQTASLRRRVMRIQDTVRPVHGKC